MALVATLVVTAWTTPLTTLGAASHMEPRGQVVDATSSRCSTPMPTTAPSGWTRKVTSTFSETVPLGSWPGPIAAVHWKNRAAGAKDSSGRGVYDSSKTVSEANGLLDIWIHSEKAGKPGVHDPSGQRYVAALVSRLGATAGARISICMRADVIPGYKLAYLLWPSEGSGNTLGEIDYPELRLVGPPATSYAFMHYAPKPASGKHQDWYDSGVAVQQWHAYTIEWNPKASVPYASFYVDGRLLGTSTKYVPSVAMTYILQHETYVPGQVLPAPAEGHVQVDWITIDVPGSDATFGGATFSDTVGNPFLEDIEWLVDEGITHGCGGGRFCPTDPVRRSQMASFLTRALGYPSTPNDYFIDDDGNAHEGDINRVAAKGVTKGCATNRYCPEYAVTRAQMATFLVRALSLPPTTKDYFADDEGSLHEDAINRLAAAGITKGCGSGRYCPSASVKRQEMAAFLHRALD